MLPPCLALHAPHLDAREPTPFRVLFPLALRQALGPAHDRTTGPPWTAGGRAQLSTSTSCKEGGRLAVLGLGAERWEMPRPPSLRGRVPQGPRLLVRPCAHAERHAPRALGGDRGLVPPLASARWRLGVAARRLFFTQRPGASPSTARGVPARPRWACTRSAWRPALRRRRATVSVATVLTRAVARPPHPSPR